MGGPRRNSPPNKRGKPIKHPVERTRVFVGSVFRNVSKVLCCKSASQGMVKCARVCPGAHRRTPDTIRKLLVQSLRFRCLGCMDNRLGFRH